MPPTEPGPAERFSIFAPDVPPTDPTAALQTALEHLIAIGMEVYTDSEAPTVVMDNWMRAVAAARASLASQADDPSGPDVGLDALWADFRRDLIDNGSGALNRHRPIIEAAIRAKP